MYGMAKVSCVLCVQKECKSYHAAASVHMTIRLIESNAKNNVFSQTGVKNVFLKYKKKEHENLNFSNKKMHFVCYAIAIYKTIAVYMFASILSMISIKLRGRETIGCFIMKFTTFIEFPFHLKKNL